MLSELYLPFSTVCLTEIKLEVDQSFLPNTELPGYSFTFQPSLSNAGGVGFYIKEDQLFTTRPDLTLSTTDFEALWVEMQNGSQHNMICGVIYRHPQGNMQNFMDFLNSTIEKIDRENTFCIILGDFNLDLLKLDSHPPCLLLLKNYRETKYYVKPLCCLNFITKQTIFLVIRANVSRKQNSN